MNIKDQQIDHRLTQIIPHIDIYELRSIPAISDAIGEFHAADDIDTSHRAFQKITAMAECVAAGMKISQNN